MMSPTNYLRTLLVLAGTLSVSGLSVADADGWPASGRPAIVDVGGTFALGDMKEGTAYVSDGENRVPVLVAPGASPLYPGAGVGQIPKDLPPGRYDLIVPGDGGETIRPAAVHVLAAFPESYTVAVLRADGVEDPTTELFSPSLLSRLVAEPVALVFVLGQLTRDGERNSYENLLAQFADVSTPVVLCPDQAELDRGVYLDVFGRPEHAFQFGKDGYLVLGPGLAHADAGTSSRIGPIHRWRRALRPSRWSVGVAGRFGLDWSMRSQLTLFVDDPLDYVLAGEAPVGMGERLPWGETRFAVPPSTPVVPLQWIDVTTNGMTARVSAVAPAPEGEATPAAE